MVEINSLCNCGFGNCGVYLKKNIYINQVQQSICYIIIIINFYFGRSMLDVFEMNNNVNFLNLISFVIWLCSGL